MSGRPRTVTPTAGMRSGSLERKKKREEESSNKNSKKSRTESRTSKGQPSTSSASKKNKNSASEPKHPGYVYIGTVERVKSDEILKVVTKRPTMEGNIESLLKYKTGGMKWVQDIEPKKSSNQRKNQK